MHQWIKAMKGQLAETMPLYGEGEINTVLEMLYSVYRKKKGGDPETVSGCYDRLDAVLNKLTLKEYDKVWDIACCLCSAAEKEGFLEGVRVGASLAEELREECSHQ